MVSRDRIQALLRDIESHAKTLDEALATNPRDVLSDFHFLGAVKYEFVVVVEACVKVAHHIIAEEGFRAPLSMGESFAVLSEQGLLDRPLAEAMGSIVGARNLLIHVYDRVDDVRFLEDLRAGREHISRFAAAMTPFLGD